MLNRLMDPAANRQVDHEDEFVDIETNQRYSSRKFKWWYILVALAVLFPYISIFALFGMVNNVKKTDTTNNYYSTANYDQVTTTFNQGLPTPSIGKTISFTDTGKLQVGAGTSVYRDLLAMDAKCPSYLSMAALTSTVYITSYGDKATFGGTLQVFATSVGANGYETATVKTTLTTTQYFYEIVTMSVAGNNAYFLAICQDGSENTETANLVSGSVDLTTFAITLGDSVKYASTYSMAPNVITLAANQFAIAFYNNDNPVALATRFGSIDINTAGYPIKMSDVYYFADNNNQAQYFSIAPLTATSYMMLYYNSFNGAQNKPVYGNLHARIGSINNLDTTPTLTMSEPAMYNMTRMQYMFSSTSLDETSVVVAYSNEGGDLVCQVLEVLQQTTTDNNVPLIGFGASWVVNSGEVFTSTLPTGYMDIDVEKVSSDSFAVLYSDVSNNGALTATMGKLSGAGELVRASPDFLLNSGNANLATMYSWGALATAVSTSLASTTGILTMVSNPSDCNTPATTQFNLLEVRPLPVGVTSLASLSSTGSVATTVTINGVIDTSATGKTLTAGVSYYANTKGDLVADKVYAGRGSSENAAGEDLGYIVDEDHNAYITTDSKVGIATAAHNLYVKGQI